MMFRHHTGAWNVGQINVLMALTDIGPGDGATVIVPSSHKSHLMHPFLSEGPKSTYRDDRPASEALMTQEVHLRKGDALMFTDALCHGSAARENEGERRIMVYRYSPHGVMPRFNYVPSDTLMARLTPERRRIVQPVPAALRAAPRPCRRHTRTLRRVDRREREDIPPCAGHLRPRGATSYRRGRRGPMTPFQTT